MAGHSKWAQIKHKKALTDAKKSKEFSRLSKLIAMESKKAKGDQNAPGLKVVVAKAKAANMPKDNIERAIEKGRKDTGADMIEVLYEMYGPGGVAILIDGLTDNNNRTNAELKHMVSKLGYEIAAPGSASWAFAKENGEWKPSTTVPVSDDDAERLDALVSALDEHEDVQAVFTNAE